METVYFSRGIVSSLITYDLSKNSKKRLTGTISEQIRHNGWYGDGANYKECD